MKKSILFSSIATTCCLLIQTSASAEWASFSGSVTHDYDLHAAWTTFTMRDGLESHNITNNGQSIYDSSNNWGGGHNAMSQSFGFSQNIGLSGPNASGGGNAGDALKGTLFFTVTETSELSISSNLIMYSLGSLNNSWSLSKYMAGSWVEISNLQNLNTYYVSDTHFITLQSETEYQINVNQNGSASAGGGMSLSYNSSFSMSLTPVPAPAVSALLALAGLVSRRRRA